MCKVLNGCRAMLRKDSLYLFSNQMINGRTLRGYKLKRLLNSGQVLSYLAIAKETQKTHPTRSFNWTLN